MFTKYRCCYVSMLIYCLFFILIVIIITIIVVTIIYKPTIP